MRVKGNAEPKAVSVTIYEPLPGKAEVRVRENVVPFEETDPMTETTVSGYEYDEYKFLVDNVIGLEQIIENDLEDWLVTGRTLEVSPNATLYVNARMDAVDEYTQQLIEEGLI